MNAAANSKPSLPYLLHSKRLSIHFAGNCFKQNKVLYYTSVLNIYCVYKLQPIDFTRDDTFTIQNTLVGAMKITKNADTSKYNYKGYGICFDEGVTFSHTIKEGNFNHTATARNLLIFGVDTSASIHATNRANDIYVMGKGLVQGINDTIIYAEKKFYRNFTDPGKKFVIVNFVNLYL